MTIRTADVTDTAALIAMGRHMRTATGYSQHLIDNPAQMAAMVKQLVESPDGVVFVAESLPWHLVGMIGMWAYPHHLDGQRVAGEIFWWTEPEARGAGLRLLREAERWAKKQGAVSVQMVAPDERVGRLYERLGYSRIETSYGKAVA